MTVLKCKSFNEKFFDEVIKMLEIKTSNQLHCLQENWKSVKIGIELPCV